MKILPLVLRLVPLAAAGAATGAQACMDESWSTSYFSGRPLERHGDTPMLRVRITGIEGRTVRAELVGPFARLSPDGTVRIDLLALPAGCVSIGPTEGPVYVIGTLVRYGSGALVMEAVPARPVPLPRRPNARRDYEQYMVDPVHGARPR